MRTSVRMESSVRYHQHYNSEQPLRAVGFGLTVKAVVVVTLLVVMCIKWAQELSHALKLPFKFITVPTGAFVSVGIIMYLTVQNY